MREDPVTPRSVILITDNALLRAGGMSLLQRLLFEVAGAADRGLLRREVVLVWPDARTRERATPIRRLPPRITLQHATGCLVPLQIPGARDMLLPADLLLSPGALAAWLSSAPAGAASCSPTEWLPTLGVHGPRQLSFSALVARLPSTPPPLIGRHVLLRIESPPQLAAGERKLFASLTKETDGYGARFLNRPMSTRLTRWLARCGVRPNHWSTLLLALTALAAALLASGYDSTFIAGIVLFNVVSVLDGCDGELARATYRQTDAGAWLDTLGDMLAHATFALAIGIGLARQSAPANPWATLYLAEGTVTSVAILFTAWSVARLLSSPQRDGTLLGFGDAVLETSSLGGWRLRLGDFISQFMRQDSRRWLWVVLALVGVRGGILHLLAMGVGAHLLALIYTRHKSRARAVVAEPEQVEVEPTG